MKRNRSVWSNDVDGSSFALCPVPEYLSGEARSHFGIARDDSILFYYNDSGFWAGQRSYTVITETGIYAQLGSEDEILFIPWASVKEVEYKEYNLDFFDYDGEYWHWGIGLFTTVTTPEQGRKMARVFTECAQQVAPPTDPFDDVAQLEDDEKYDAALALLEKKASSGEIDRDTCRYHFYKGRILVKQESQFDEMPEDREAIVNKEFNKALEFCDEDEFDEVGGYCDYWRAYHYMYLGQNYNARNLFILAMESKSESMRDDAKESVPILESGPLSEIWDKYTSVYDYQDRKFIMPIRDGDIAGCIASGIDTFRMSNIPGCFKFPTGHPVAGELYIGHPFNPSLYVPYSESEDIFFDDKIDELTYLLQCLGAEEITITSIKGRSVSEYEARSMHGDLHIDTGLSDGKVSGGKAGKVDRNQDSRQQHSLHIKCDPMKYPYVPEGLVWYGEQPKWQRMAEGRLNGNRLEYSEFISSTETRFVSSTERKDIKAAAERLWIKIDGSAETNLETQFKEHTETQWRVDVKFRSLREFSKEPQIAAPASLQIASADEEEYLEMFKEYSADGELSERDRKMLDKFRVRCGISEQRALELEASCAKPQLTEDEQEYLEMYREYAAEGSISERDRKMLGKMRVRMGISEERAKEIEQY